MQSRPLFALLLLAFAQADDEPTCLGPFFIDGDDAPAYLVSSPANTGGATLTGSSIELHHNSRFYLARECRLAPDAYASWSLVGRRLSFTADLNGAGCACNTAVYLTSLPQNTLPGTCHGDYYCDATSICGVSCAEVDLMRRIRKPFTRRRIFRPILVAAAAALAAHSMALRYEIRCINTARVIIAASTRGIPIK